MDQSAKLWPFLKHFTIVTLASGFIIHNLKVLVRFVTAAHQVRSYVVNEK